MLDIRRVRSNPEGVKEALAKRHGNFPIDEVLKLDEKRRKLLVEVENMKEEQNKTSKEIPQLKKEGKDVDEVFKRMKALSDEVKNVDNKVREIDEQLKAYLLEIPNTPHESVVEGEDDDDNVEVRKWGEPKEFEFEPKAHWDIGTDLGILDFERASKITGARFTLFKGAGAKLERAIINYMLNLHTSEHGYEEMATP